MMDILIVLAWIIYAVVVSIFYTSVEMRLSTAGSLKKIKWTYLDLIGVLISAPISVAVGTVAGLFWVIGVILFWIADVTKAYKLVDTLESMFDKLARLLIKWKDSNNIVKALLKPIRKKG